MSYCTECSAVEQGFEYAEGDDAEEIPICKCCGMEDTRVIVDEDYGRDR